MRRNVIIAPQVEKLIHLGKRTLMDINIGKWKITLPLILTREEVQAWRGFAFSWCWEWSPPWGSAKKMKNIKILGFFRPLTWIYGLRPPGLKFMGCILKWGGDSEGALNNQKGYKTKLKTNLFKKHIVPYFASNLWLDNAFINDTNVFCPCRLRQEKVSENIQQYSVQPHIAFEA